MKHIHIVITCFIAFCLTIAITEVAYRAAKFRVEKDSKAESYHIESLSNNASILRKLDVLFDSHAESLHSLADLSLTVARHTEHITALENWRALTNVGWEKFVSTFDVTNGIPTTPNPVEQAEISRMIEDWNKTNKP